MNDAEQSWTGGLLSHRIAWFQVGLPDPPLPSSGPPIRAVLECAADVVLRVGTLDLQAVQLLLPLHLGAVPVENLLTQQSWFASATAASATP